MNMILLIVRCLGLGGFSVEVLDAGFYVVLDAVFFYHPACLIKFICIENQSCYIVIMLLKGNSVIEIRG